MTRKKNLEKVDEQLLHLQTSSILDQISISLFVTKALSVIC